MRILSMVCFVVFGAAVPALGGELVFEQKFDDAFVVPETRAAFAAVRTLDDGRPALVVECLDATEKTQPLVSVNLEVDDLAGETVRFRVLARAETISKPAVHYHGGKFNLMVKDHDDKVRWPGVRIGGGSFDWKELSFTVDVPYGAKTVIAFFGLQGATGKIMFRDFRVETTE